MRMSAVIFHFRSAGDSRYCEYGGYKSGQTKATGFFRVERITGKWRFVDPHGHLFVSAGFNGLCGRGGGRAGGAGTLAGAVRRPAQSLL